MKRKLSLLLAVVMILGSFSFAFAADEVVPAEFLEKEGILVGNDSGDLMLDQPLLRKDAVVLLARLMKAEEEAEAFEKEGLPTFNDLADNPYYKGFLAWAEDNGYFTGKTDGSFGYTDNLEAVEYALVLLRALGYVNDNKADEWDNAWTEAEKLGLLEDVKAERRDEIKREEVAQMTYNALGVTMKDSDKTLAEFLGITMPEADELEVVEVYTENLAEVVVELSNAKLVKNKEALTNPNNYRLSDSDVKVHNVDVDGNDVILTLVPYGRVTEQEGVRTLVKGREYKLTIRNIEGISQTEKFVAKDVAGPTVEDVEFIGTYGIKVTTSEPVSNPQERNFKVDGKRTSMIIEQYGRVLILTPYHEREFDKDATELVVEELEDFAGYRLAISTEDMELSSDDATPIVEKAYRSGNKLTLVFDRDIYRESVSENKNRRNTGNVSFVERRVTFYADTAKKVDTNVAVYEFEREIPRDAVVTVEGVQNHFKKTMEKQEVDTELYVDDYAPVVISKLSANVESTDVQERGKVTQSTKGLKVEFDKDIRELVDAVKHIEDKELTDEDAIKDELNEYFKSDLDKFFEVYRLEVSRKGRNDASDVKLVVEEVKSDSITISFKDIVVNDKYRDYDYVLEVQDFTDLNRNRMVREYIDFQIVPKGKAFDVDGDIEIVRGRYEGEVEVVIKFNDYVDKDEAENPKNYYFGKDGKDLIVDVAIVERDGKTVSLLIRDTTIAKVQEKEILEISPRITNLDDDPISGSRFFNLKTGKRIVDEEAAAKVEELIEALPNADDITAIGDVTPAIEEQVAKAREALNALTEAQQKLVENKDKLEAIENKIKELKDADENAQKIQEAVDAVNAATDYTIANVLVENAEILGLDLTEFNKLENKAPVYAALVDKNFADAPAIKTAFDTAVQTQAGVEVVLAELNAAKAAVEGAEYTLDNSVDDITAANTAVKAIVDALEEVADKGITVTVTNDTFSAPDTTDPDNLVDGTYTFTVKLEKSGQDVTTKTLTATIPAE